MRIDPRRLITRRNFLLCGAGASMGVAGGATFARMESKWLKTTFKKISGLGLAQPLRVLHLSDFHASWCVPWKQIRESVEMGLAEKPDLILLTGDYVSTRKDKIDGYPEALAPLAGHPHSFAVFGNHDWKYYPEGSRARQIEAKMAEAGVRCLVNQMVELDVRGTAVRIAGLGDLWRHEALPEQCLRPAGEDGPLTLLLAHNPDTKELVESYAWDVMFSGHTHGGQVVVPWLRWAPVLPVDDRSMVAGIYPWKGRHIHITRGVGCLHGIRFACPPEVSIIDLS